MVLQQRDLSTKLIQAEIPIIQKILRDEAWYEGERRGCYVPLDDSVVLKRVCQIIQKCDTKIRQQALKAVQVLEVDTKR